MYKRAQSRTGTKDNDRGHGRVSGAPLYEVPEGPLCLAGPVVRPAPGTLPLRGDLAHIELAGKYLAAHYVIPQQMQVGDKPVTLKLNPRDDSDDGVTLDAGSGFEALDFAGDWVWGCTGPEGPSGYLLRSDLA